MVISDHTKQFINGLIDYYISEASSYKQIAEQYTPEVNSIEDTAFGIIVGCVYSGFLQAYANQKKKVELDDIQDFHKILKDKSQDIKIAILENKTNPEIESNS